MRYLLFIISLFFIGQSLSAQSLIYGKRTSPYTYIYKITNEEAEEIYSSSISIVDESYFHSKIDSIATDDINDLDLKVGHYLLSSAKENRHNLSLTSVNNLEIRLINNDQDFQVMLYDSLGNTIPNANVKVNNRKVKFNNDRSSYYRHKSNIRGLMKIEFEGHTSFFPVRRAYNNTLVARAYRKIKYKSPIKYLWRPFVDIYRSIRWGYPYGYIERIASWFEPKDSEDKYGGYLVFNKPKYRPDDTVKFKAYIVKKSLKRFNKDLTVRIGNYKTKPKIIGEVAPTSKGVYLFEFILHDSLNLALDSRQFIYLDKKKYHTVISKGFGFEDYELSTTNFSLESNLEKHFRSEPLELIMEAKDENDLNLPDAGVEFIVVPERVRSFEGQQVFVSDTLFKYNMKLDAIGKTRFILPDSIFPNASIDYTVKAKFLTSNNEWSKKELDLTYKHELGEFDMNLIADSIEFNYIKNGKSIPAKATLLLLASQDEILTRPVELPFKEKIYPSASSYIIYDDNQNTNFQIDSEDDGVNVTGFRTEDSVYFDLENKRNIPFWYTIFAGKKEITHGILKEGLKNISFKSTTKKPYYISYQYLWAGQIRERENEVPFYDKNLRISSNEPNVISPGQKAKIEISVIDQKGSPVSNVDLTAYGYKKSMKGSSPEVPYFGNIYNQHVRFNSFSKSFHEKLSSNDYLNYEEKKKEYGLDSIAFYQFLYPNEKLYKSEIPLKNGTTQFAPYVVDSIGNFQKVHIIYVDNFPVYFSFANDDNYSFYISPNSKHTIRLRLSNEELLIKNISFKRGQKTIISLDKDRYEKVDKTLKKQFLTEEEQRTLSNYFIVVDNNFKNQYAYIKQYNRVQFVGSSNQYSYNAKTLTGPWRRDNAKIIIPGSYESNFEVEPDYEYKFDQVKVKLQRLDPEYFKKWLYNSGVENKTFGVEALTEEQIRAEWDSYLESLNKKMNRFHNPQTTEYGKSRINLELSDSLSLLRIYIDKIILKGLSNPNILRVYRPTDWVFENIEVGDYSIIFLLEDNTYFEYIAKDVHANGTLYIDINKTKILPVDSTIQAISEILKKDKDQTNFTKGDLDKDLRLIKEISHVEPSKYSSFDRKIVGKITSIEDGSALPGVNVVVKGTTIGTVADIDGNYTIYAPRGSVLVFSFIGLATQEVECGSRSIIDLQLSPDVTQLSEVIVTGLAVERTSRALAYSISSVDALQGKVAGVKISRADGSIGAASSVKIRGEASIVGNSQALIIVDGKPFLGKQSDLDPNTIQSIETLSPDAGNSLYGVRGINGVIIIKTKIPSSKGSSDDNPELFESGASSKNSIRNNFSDYVYWEPNLITDKNGKASFEVKYPDDITHWKTYILGMGRNRYTGQYEGSVKSVKSIVSQLSLPKFLVQGDSTIVLGKVTNYTTDTLEVNLNFGINDSIINTTTTLLKRSILDSMVITTTSEDSLRVLFSMKSLNNNYFDGEERFVEIKRKGIEISKGYFFQMKKDSVYNLSFNEELGDVTLDIYQSESEIIESEAIKLSSYMYNCNEQMASKLIGLLTIKQIEENKGDQFKKEREVKSLIRKLEKNQNDEDQWGWWGESESEDWISLHVLKALLKAKELGYTTKFRVNRLIRNLKWSLEDYSIKDQLKVLRILNLLGENMDYASYLREVKSKLRNLQDTIKYSQLHKDLLGSIDAEFMDTLLNKRKETYLENYYWDDGAKRVYNNTFLNTIYMINLLSGIDSLNDIRQKAIGYLIEKRSFGKWKNTYESSLAIDALINNKLLNGTNKNDYKFSINGKLINDFNNTMRYNTDSVLTVKNEGENILYLSAYQTEWVENPKAFEDYMAVTTKFDHNSKKIKAGREETLKVEVLVKKEIDYVMLEVPIPAGFSYAQKSTNYMKETHREYYKEKTNIYLRTLRPGKHTFEIKLMPRYKGTYTMNPTKVESMYFPAYNGNNETKSVIIK